MLLTIPLYAEAAERLAGDATPGGPCGPARCGGMGLVLLEGGRDRGWPRLGPTPGGGPTRPLPRDGRSALGVCGALWSSSLFIRDNPSFPRTLLMIITRCSTAAVTALDVSEVTSIVQATGWPCQEYEGFSNFPPSTGSLQLILHPNCFICCLWRPPPLPTIFAWNFL